MGGLLEVMGRGIYEERERMPTTVKTRRKPFKFSLYLRGAYRTPEKDRITVMKGTASGMSEQPIDMKRRK